MKENDHKEETTHFGFRQVPLAEKAEHVASVFHSVAGKYDMMNDIMSLGTHRLIKRFTLQLTALRSGQQVLDLAGGTGDFAMQFSPIVGEKGHVVLADINQSMLSVGRDRIIDKGGLQNISYSLADAEQLPFLPESFDCVCIAYGLRNVTDKEAALRSMHEVLKPGGRMVILEFSRTQNPMLSKGYDFYSKLWPLAGKLVTGDSDSYQYLVESIRMHPDQETLKSMILDAGFSRCEYHNVMDGICAIHIGYKDAT
ncbi:MAG: bifunctional demethylmenaquinone methyltransferase/2-methoxy-6-polyprenyl-1,4-benzoquinol methylase [Gammaproteobacteria bacterium]|nr:bifunctional demethylmenaquinone methyltransferase/2-methoxy-6-polyprenyl-1,4-benzoquinol methylase [Gammaproteobacteria bacterium]|tara:strand:- start:27515 stop:28279 length:765 start_codon:yes stop_codon:yes gene_type:complete